VSESRKGILASSSRLKTQDSRPKKNPAARGSETAGPEQRRGQLEINLRMKKV